jgi:hypothetical protein
LLSVTVLALALMPACSTTISGQNKKLIFTAGIELTKGIILTYPKTMILHDSRSRITLKTTNYGR